MKKLIAIGFISISLVACNRKQKAELEAREAQIEQQERIQDSIRIVEETRDNLEAEQAADQASASATRAVTRRSTGGGVASSSGTSSSPSTASSGTTTTTQQEKKGLSNKAKGAIIGAGVGAVTGAVIDKDHRGRGAIIGTVVGAGAGLGAGAIIDKKKEQKEGGN